MAGLQEPALRKRDDGIAGHDRVVEHPYVNQCQRVTNAVRDELVGLRGFGNPRGAVVEEEDCEDLVVLNGKPESQVVARGARVRQRGPLRTRRARMVRAASRISSTVARRARLRTSRVNAT